jgi:hypothetical protein
MAGKRNDEFTADIVRQLQAAAPDIAAERVREIAADMLHHIRQDWGGCRPYIRKDPLASWLARSTGYRLRKRR